MSASRRAFRRWEATILLRLRLRGWFSRSRIVGAGKLLLFGAWLHNAMVDLALWAEPRLGPVSPPSRPFRGLAVLVLLVAGVALMIGGAGFVIVQALPHREARP